MRGAVIGLAIVAFVGLLCFSNVLARDPQTIERDPSDWRTFRAYVNHGIAARDAGQYVEAMQSLLYVYSYAPHACRAWLIATVNLAMCCEVLGQDEAADKYYRDAGKFCPLSNNMRSGKEWRKLRHEIEQSQNETYEKLDGAELTHP